VNTAIPRCPFCKTMLVGIQRTIVDAATGSHGQSMGWYCPMPVGLEHDRFLEHPEWVYVETAKD
jgi:hypothetical protein